MVASAACDVYLVPAITRRRRKRENSGAHIMSKTSLSVRQKPSGTYSDVCGPRTVWRRPTGLRFTQSKQDAAPDKCVEEQRLLDEHTARHVGQASRTRMHAHKRVL